MTSDELEGFEVFCPTPKGLLMSIELKVSGNLVQLTYGAVKALNYPEYVNFFFDRRTQRVMVKSASEKMPNTLKLKSNDIKKKAILGIIPRQELAVEILQTAKLEDSKTVYFAGHVPGKTKETLIFHLTEQRMIKTKGEM